MSERTNEQDMMQHSRPRPHSEQVPGIGDGARSRWQAPPDFGLLIVDTIREGLLVLDPQFRVQRANGAFYQMFTTSPEEVVGRSIYDLDGGQWDVPPLRRLLSEILPENEFFNDYELTFDMPDSGERILRLNARRIDHRQLILLAIEDVTAPVHAARQVAEMNATLEQRIAERTAHVQALIASLNRAEEKERQRIAQILHDDLQQQLYAVQIQATLAAQGVEEETPASTREALEQITGWLNGAIATTRHLSVSLSPPVLQQAGIAEALRWLADEMLETHALHVKLSLDERVQAGQDERILLYQAARELLFNIVKHADAGEAELRLQQDAESIILDVRDEGRGFNPAVLDDAEWQGFGLASLVSRLKFARAALEIDSTPGDGTRVTVRLPKPEPLSG